MRPITILALAAAPLLAVAASNADIKCVKEPCLGFNKVLGYCATKYGEHLKTFQKITNTKGIACMCGHEGVEGVTEPEDMSVTGAITIVECFECGNNNAAGKEFLEAWADICLTAEKKGLAAAEKCWNTATDCYQS